MISPTMVMNVAIRTIMTFTVLIAILISLLSLRKMKKNETGKTYTYPDVQYMDMNYDRYYLVPWPDYQKFEELDEESMYVIPAYVD